VVTIVAAIIAYALYHKQVNQIVTNLISNTNATVEQNRKKVEAKTDIEANRVKAQTKDMNINKESKSKEKQNNSITAHDSKAKLQNKIKPQPMAKTDAKKDSITKRSGDTKVKTNVATNDANKAKEENKTTKKFSSKKDLAQTETNVKNKFSPFEIDKTSTPRSLQTFDRVDKHQKPKSSQKFETKKNRDQKKAFKGQSSLFYPKSQKTPPVRRMGTEEFLPGEGRLMSTIPNPVSKIE
jgi:hypothetical protein